LRLPPLATPLLLIAATPAAGIAFAQVPDEPRTGAAPAVAPLLAVAALPVKAPEPRRPVFPVKGRVRFGGEGARYGSARGGRRHEGQDVFAASGTPLVAMRDSVVVETGDGGGRGHYVALYSPAVRRTYLYLHMLRPARVKRGQRLGAGHRVGQLGCTGSCYGDHLHLEIRRGRGTAGAPENPLPELRRAARNR